jgi:hypothetical protein
VDRRRRPAKDNPPEGDAVSAGLDPTKCLRLKTAIDSTLASIDNDAASGNALPDAYTAMRAETRSSIDDDNLGAEFDRLFPEGPGARGAVPMSTGMRSGLERASRAAEARALLARLSGWLNGFVENTRMAHEAREYAAARLAMEQRRTGDETKP